MTNQTKKQREVDLSAARYGAISELIKSGRIKESDQDSCDISARTCAKILGLHYADGSKPRSGTDKEDALISWFYTKRIVVIKSAKSDLRHVVVNKVVNADVKLMKSAARNVSKQNKSKRKVSSKSFYQSKAWKELRALAFSVYGNKCQCCGASPETGAVLHVDHIKPRSLYPRLELALKNLQILCAECIIGKLNLNDRDYREVV